MDWLDCFREDPSGKIIAEALAGPFDDLNCDPEGAVAAAEVVALLLGMPSAIPHEELDELPRVEIPSALRADAARALELVLKDSWLRQSWEETQLLDSWIAGIADLQERLA